MNDPNTTTPIQIQIEKDLREKLELIAKVQR